MWINPPMATEETIPKTQSTNKTTAIVSSILISLISLMNELVIESKNQALPKAGNVLPTRMITSTARLVKKMRALCTLCHTQKMLKRLSETQRMTD